MPRTALTIQPCSLAAGLKITPEAADKDNGMSFANSGKDLLWVDNASVGNIVVTIQSQKACDLGFEHDLAITVTAACARFLGPFNTSRFNDATGLVQVDVDDDTTVTVAVIRASV